MTSQHISSYNQIHSSIHINIYQQQTSMTTSGQQPAALMPDNQTYSSLEIEIPKKEGGSMVEVKADIYVEYPYRWFIVILYCLISLMNGAMWVVATPNSVTISKAYNISESYISLIPMSYLILYIPVNFPSNWVLDTKGLRMGIMLGALFTAFGAAIRCLVPFGFAFIMIGEFFCALAQPFILNATAKITVKWFFPQNRTFVLTILTTMNAIGTGIGFLIPPLFITEPEGGSAEIIKQQFANLNYCQFALSIIPTILIIIFFKDKPASPPSYCSGTQSTPFLAGIKSLFVDKRFILLNLALGVSMGSYCLFGSLLDDIFNPFNFSSNQVSNMGVIMMGVGIIVALFLGYYVQRTKDYHRVFILIAVLSIVQSILLPFFLKYFPDQQFVAYIIICLQGIEFIPLIPLTMDYSCDVLYPAGEAMVTGCLNTTGQIFGIVFTLISTQGFKLGDFSQSQNQTAAIDACIVIGVINIVGILLYPFFNYDMTRTQIDTDTNRNEGQHNAKENTILNDQLVKDGVKDNQAIKDTTQKSLLSDHT